MNKDIIFTKSIKGQILKFNTTWGLFSPKELDKGSLMLMHNIHVQPTDDILDIGCGYGPLGIHLALQAPEGITHMLDKDFVAIEYAIKNAKQNKAKNTSIYLSNGLSEVPKDTKFDVIVSNIPAKVGNKLLIQMIEDSYKHLKKDGTLYIVTLPGISKFIKRKLQETFGNYTRVVYSRQYTLGKATK